MYNLINESSIDDWLDVLKPYQRNSLRVMLEDSDELECAKQWVSSHGTDNTIPFGGVCDTKPFWDNLKNEFNKFICDDGQYVGEKARLNAENPITRAILVSAISAALGASLGFAATLVAPAVALLLFTVGKMTRNAYCNTYYKNDIAT